MLLVALSLVLLGQDARPQGAGSTDPGPSAEAPLSTSLEGRVMCGYQGWFSAKGDGAGRGWVHYGARGRFGPGHCTIDLWPDVSELGEDELFDTPFRLGDGSPARVFSSFRRATVVRHFAWMEEHGIDGVFLQRFGASLRAPKPLAHRDAVLSHVRAGAAEHGRTWSLMYDLSGLGPGEIESVVMADWRRLRGEGITADRTYQRHRGRPLVAVWGVGFAGADRRYSLEECAKLVRLLRADGCAVMLGVPTFWRELRRDAVRDEALHELLAEVDVISPWTVGRYGTPEAAVRHGESVVRGDLAWCEEKGVELLPVVFPGFSWRNLKAARGEEAPLDQIPRRGGRFLWSQAAAFHRAGAGMLYVAMFDELDEGTAIFKCTSDTPVGDTPFLELGGLPSDHYLWLTGRIGAMLRGEIAPDAAPPKRR